MWDHLENSYKFSKGQAGQLNETMQTQNLSLDEFGVHHTEKFEKCKENWGDKLCGCGKESHDDSQKGWCRFESS